MVLVGDKLVSLGVFARHFVCDLSVCRGTCCVEGTYGAPIRDDEALLLQNELEGILPYLESNARTWIETHGITETDPDGELVTTCINSMACSFAIRGENNIWGCGIEVAHHAGASSLHKPISCHLYPIRVEKIGTMDALYYDHWEICVAACALGEKLKVPVYQFLKAPIIRAYGEAWYNDLEDAARAYEPELVDPSNS